MKKFISCALVVCMVVAIVAMIPMTASAATSGGLHTSRYWIDTPEADTGLDAFYGTPEIVSKMGTTFGAVNGSAEVTTLKDSAWDKAYKVTYNPEAMSNNFFSSVDSNNDYDIYLLWDNDNLYVLQDTRKLFTLKSGESDLTLEQIRKNENKYTLGVWGSRSGNKTINVEHSYYQILLPREMTNLGDETKRPLAYAVSAFPALNDAAVTGYDIYEGVSLVRDFDYTNTTGVNSDKDMLVWATDFTTNEGGTFEAGIRTFVERLDGGAFRTSTVIPWAAIDSTPDDAFANLTKEEKAGQQIGIWLFNKGVKHMYHNGFWYPGKVGKDNPNDTAGYEAVTLYNSKSDVPAVTPRIEPDYDHWFGTEGQFTLTPPVVGGEAATATYYIDDAGDLLALAKILEKDAYNSANLAQYGLANANNKALLSLNKTFKLTADIDLNPQVTDWAEVNEYLVKKYSGEAVDASELESPLPNNIFLGFDWFYGMIDGQGHAIKGLFNPDGYTTTVSGKATNCAGLIGRLGAGGITNLIIESGYLGTSALHNNQCFGGLIGELRPYAAYTDTVNGKIEVSNVVMGENYTMHRWGIDVMDNNGAGRTYNFGAVCSTYWAESHSTTGNKMNITFSDIVVNSSVYDGATNVGVEGAVNLFWGSNIKNGGANGWTNTWTIKDVIVNVDEGCTTAVNGNATKVTKGGDVPAGLVKMTDGTAAPVKVADMLADTKWQASAAADGRFYVRFVSEVSIADMNDYEAIGHKITITGKKGDEVITVTEDLTDNTNVYAGVKAGDVTVTADSDEFNVIDGNYLVASIINLPAIDGVTYTATVQTIYKVSETVTITGCAEDLGAIAPLN